MTQGIQKEDEDLEIINTILDKFVEQNRDEIFQVDKNGNTALTCALSHFSDKGDEALTILEKIIDTAAIEDKTILEVGPGTGNLTSYILKKNPKRIRNKKRGVYKKFKRGCYIYTTIIKRNRSY